MKLSRLSFIGAFLLLAVVATSCGENSPTAPATPTAAIAPAPEGELLELLTPLTRPLGLLTCRPLAEDWETKWIGPLGGVIEVGPHRLVIPAGALENWVRITAHMPTSRQNRVEFWPHGLEFEKTTFLTMSYANCDLLGILLPKKIAYTDGGLNILYLLQSIDNIFTKKVTGKLNHFSDYAISW